MITTRFIIRSCDYNPIKNVMQMHGYLTSSFITSSCNWDNHVYCDVSITDNMDQTSMHKWMSITGSGCQFISVI
jgi:hypothetical protein